MNVGKLHFLVTSMLVTKSVSGNFNILVTVLAILITDIDFFYNSVVSNIQKMSPSSLPPKSLAGSMLVTNVGHVTNITIAKISITRHASSFRTDFIESTFLKLR